MNILKNVVAIIFPLALAFTLYYFAIGYTDRFMSISDAFDWIKFVVPDLNIVNEKVAIGRKALDDFFALGWTAALTPIVIPLVPHIFIEYLYEGFAPVIIFLVELIVGIVGGIFGLGSGWFFYTFIPTTLPTTPFDDLDTSGWLEIISDSIVTF